MKVILVNGSPKKNGCTYTALTEVAGALEKNGIETEIFHVGNKPLAGCMGCGACLKTGKCFMDDTVNEFVEKAKEADGFVFGTPVVSCRRGGASAAFDQLNKYFTISSMPVVSSQYWNQVHGTTPEEVRQDEEGMQTMRTLGNNMAWLLKCIELGKKEGIPFPEGEKKIATNFIRK